jgi:hypothetical protein
VSEITKAKLNRKVSMTKTLQTGELTAKELPTDVWMSFFQIGRE